MTPRRETGGAADGADHDPAAIDPVDPEEVLRDAQAFLAGEAALLEGLGSVLDELAEAEAAEAATFDTAAMWERVQAQVWTDRT